MKCKTNSSITSWTVSDCVEWIREQMKMPEYANALEENEITGDVLLQLSSADWKEMGVAKIGHRKKLENGIEELKLFKFVSPLSSNKSIHNTQFSSQQLYSSQSIKQQQLSSQQQSSSSSQLIPLYQKNPIAEEEDVKLMDQLDSLKLVERQCIQCGDYFSQLIHLQFCKHEVCSHCLKKNASESQNHVVHCSYCDNLIDDKDLSKVMTEKELNQFNSAMIVQALKKTDPCCTSSSSANQEEVVMHCPNTNCAHVFLWNKEEKDGKYKCPSCKQFYCLHCTNGTPYHFGQTCVQYKAAQNLLKEKAPVQQFVASETLFV